MSAFLDDDVVGYIDEKVRAGVPRDIVLRAAGVSTKDYRDILKLASQGEEPHATWIETLDQAEATAKVEHMMVLATSPDWRARKEAAELAMAKGADHQKAQDWLLRVVQEETSDEVFDRILSRLDSQEPGSSAATPPEDGEPQVH